MNETLWYLSRATGVASIVLLTVVVVLGVLTSGRRRPHGEHATVVMAVHRWLSLGMVAFLVVHVATAVAETYVSIDLVSALVPFTSGYETAWVGLGMLRISFAIPLVYLVVPGYLLVIAMLWLCDRDFVAIAVDAGGVATGPLSNSFLLALALGASAAAGGQDPLVQGLGFVVLIALAPITSVMMLGIYVRSRATAGV